MGCSGGAVDGKSRFNRPGRDYDNRCLEPGQKRAPPVEPSPITPLDAPGYRWIARAVRGALPNAVVAPALVLGGTDSKHFLSLQTIPPPVLRFRPVALGPADIATVHGVDERVRIDAFTRAIAIDAAILRAAAAAE